MMGQYIIYIPCKAKSYPRQNGEEENKWQLILARKGDSYSLLMEV